MVDATGATVDNEAELVAASARFSCPLASSYLAVSVQDLMAADKAPARAATRRRPAQSLPRASTSSPAFSSQTHGALASSRALAQETASGSDLSGPRSFLKERRSKKSPSAPKRQMSATTRTDPELLSVREKSDHAAARPARRDR